MKSPRQIPFTAACSIGKDSFLANVVIDRKNNSIHLHLHGEMFGKKRMPIKVKTSEMELKEGKEIEMITQILTDHFLGQPVQVRRIEKPNDQEDLGATGHPLRIIVRFKN